MTIELTVSDVRIALQKAAGGKGAGVGEPANVLLGIIFHQTFADLISSDSERSGLAVITEAMGDDARRFELLLSRVWTRSVAPRLLRHGASLQNSSSEVLMFWKAVQNLCRWLDEIVLELLAEYPETWGAWERLKDFLGAEVPISCEIFNEGWSEPVRLVGVADSILSLPGRSAFCGIELKLGRAKPAVEPRASRSLPPHSFASERQGTTLGILSRKIFTRIGRATDWLRTPKRSREPTTRVDRRPFRSYAPRLDAATH